MVTLYLYEEGGQLVPEWAAYASHTSMATTWPALG